MSKRHLKKSFLKLKSDKVGPIIENEDRDQLTSTAYEGNGYHVDLKGKSIGSFWSMEMTILKSSTSHYEAVECLRRIEAILIKIDKKDRIKFCKTDFDKCTSNLLCRRNLWSNSLFGEVCSLKNNYFNESYFQVLPLSIIQEIFMWIDIKYFPGLLSVCKEWNKIGTSNQIWRIFYFKKFHHSNQLLMTENIIGRFKDRIHEPFIHDKVEVSWKGKFRLETQEVYQGLAWWVAEIVDKHPSQFRYKIRYPGWESRWDEWVPRSRLRWAVSFNLIEPIYAGDIVELWCCGTNVPGAWLECKVRKVRSNRYCLGRVISNGYLWVERERIRLVRRSNKSDKQEPLQKTNYNNNFIIFNPLPNINCAIM